MLALEPDLVINDMLDTPREYMEHLKAANIPVVNFEDEGPGSVLADQVVNALYEEPQNGADGKQPERFLYGHKYFCLRDEFLQAEQNVFRPAPKCVLITFGGTDMPDYTRQTLDAVEPLCRERGIRLITCLGTGNRLDPSMLRVGNLPDTAGTGCPLSRIMRKELRRRGITDLTVVYSLEVPVEPAGVPAADNGRHPPASMAFVPPAAGFLMASYAVREPCWALLPPAGYR